jgi:hypothetical protein
MNYTKEQLKKLSLQYSDKKKLAEVIGLSEYQTRSLLKKMGIKSDGRIQSNQKNPFQYLLKKN